MTDQANVRKDEAASKGAVEDDAIQSDPGSGKSSMGGQLGHRDHDEMLKDNDTDFPEPDAKAENAGK
jgi:hypothetical protein